MASTLRLYVLAIIRHGWWLGFALIGVVGDVATVYGNFNVPRPAWYAIIAVGVLAAQFRAYSDVLAELSRVRSRLRELDTVEAKRAYIEEQIEHARGLRREFEEIVFVDDPSLTYPWQETEGVATVAADLSHWEDRVRADLKEWWSVETTRLFDSERDLEPGPDGDGRIWLSRANCIAYVDRRLVRLHEIRRSL